MAVLKGFIASVFVKRQRRDKGVKENQTVQLGGRFRPAAALTTDAHSHYHPLYILAIQANPVSPERLNRTFNTANSQIVAVT